MQVPGMQTADFMALFRRGTADRLSLRRSNALQLKRSRERDRLVAVHGPADPYHFYRPRFFHDPGLFEPACFARGSG